MTNKQNPQNDLLLTELKKIATAVQDGTSALTNGRPERTRGEVDSSRAPLLLDYLVIRELLGRADPNELRTFAARRTPAVPPTSSKAASSSKPTPSLLTLEELPPNGAKVAVFIRPGKPAETVILAESYPKGSQSNDYQLKVVKDDEPIVRLELLRADDYPIALGPRLGAV
ncbi:hypothetical protein ACQEVF_57005 [Nonomuraea polychroma]|uniref:hypothetical protein n=1 Tax=Nonomuraea polychroma TaxID=46176 RepID=UPI003D920880